RDGRGPPHRRDRQGGHRVPERPLAGARPDGVPRPRDGRGRPREEAPARRDHVEQREGAAGRVPAPLLLPLHPLPRPRHDGPDRGGPPSRDGRVAAPRGAVALLRPARRAGPAQEAVHQRAPRLDQAAGPRGRLSRDARARRGRDAALYGSAAQERAGRRGAAPRRRAPQPAGLMFVSFFLALRDAKVPCTLREYLTLLEAVEAGVAGFDVEGFYHVARAALVKDERYFDRFDTVFAKHFGSLAEGIGVEPKELPVEWLRQLSQRVLTEEEKALVQALGGWEKLMEELAKRLAEQKERHEGGSKWIGTGGTSPFGAYGYNPEGIRIGQDGSRNRSAVKVWDRREFRDGDGDVELGTRGMKMAIRSLRVFVREGAAEEFDIEGTIDATARNAGLLDLKMRPERRNRAKVLLFVDVGGSMDDHVQEVSRLFSAVKAEFAGFEHWY